MNNSFKVCMPISVNVGVRKKKTEYLNLNKYRNNHGHVNNTIKKLYKKIAEKKLSKVLKANTFYEYYELKYELFLPNKMHRDISNVLSIVDKSFNDAIVEFGIVEDDYYKYLQNVYYCYGGYDEEGEGYVEITVTEVDNNKEV